MKQLLKNLTELAAAAFELACVELEMLSLQDSDCAKPCRGGPVVNLRSYAAQQRRAR
jgi:hypothetical protein